jgi:hypothetical protein
MTFAFIISFFFHGGRGYGSKEIVLVGHQTNIKTVSSAAGPQARVVGLLPSGSGPKRRSHPNSPIVGTGIEVGDLSTSPDIDYVQGRVNKRKSEEFHSPLSDIHFGRKLTLVHA